MKSSLRHLVFFTLLIAAISDTWSRLLLYESETTLWADAVAKSPGKARPHNNYGHALKEAHRAEEARPHFEQAIALKPDYADALNNLATLYGGDGNKNNARILLNQVLAIDPGHLQARSNLALNLYEAGLRDDAVREYSIIISYSPLSKEAAFARSMLNFIAREQSTR